MREIFFSYQIALPERLVGNGCNVSSSFRGTLLRLSSHRIRRPPSINFVLITNYVVCHSTHFASGIGAILNYRSANLELYVQMALSMWQVKKHWITPTTKSRRSLSAVSMPTQLTTTYSVCRPIKTFKHALPTCDPRRMTECCRSVFLWQPQQEPLTLPIVLVRHNPDDDKVGGRNQHTSRQEEAYITETIRNIGLSKTLGFTIYTTAGAGMIMKAHDQLLFYCKEGAISTMFCQSYGFHGLPKGCELEILW